MRIAAIDQGTTSTRLLVMRADEEPCIVHQIEHRQHFPRPQWVEHDPQELLAHVSDCLAAAGRVDAIGLANQGESCLAWDRVTGEAISPVIVWQDARAAAWIERLRLDGAEEITLARAGLPLDAYFAASKLRWILDHVPEARSLLGSRRLRLGTTDAFFLDRLTGRFVTDPTTASRTCLMNLATGEWDPALCEVFGIPMEALPEIVSTTGEFGGIAGVPVAASLVDQQAALWGHGCREPGDAKITFGTGAFALAVTGEAVEGDRHRGCVPTVAWDIGGRKTYALDAGIYNAGSAVDWLERLGLGTRQELTTFVRPPAIERELVFVPALSGLASPYWDRSATGLWLGLSLDTTRADMAQALLEGVALQTAQAVTALATETPLHGVLSVDGGLARNPYFLDVLASALGRPVDVPGFGDMSAFGAASLAATAIGAPAFASRLDARTVWPRFEAHGWHERFEAAVTRARGWRRSTGASHAAESMSCGSHRSQPGMVQ